VHAKAAMVTSGTAINGNSIICRAGVVCLKGSAILTDAKRVIKVKYISLVNLIMIISSKRINTGLTDG